MLAILAAYDMNISLISFESDDSLLFRDAGFDSKGSGNELGGLVLKRWMYARN